MKKVLKALTYFVFATGSKIKSNFFSSKLLSFGYLIRSEYYYHHCKAETYSKDRFQLHQDLASIYVNPGTPIHFFEFGVLWGQIIKRWSDVNLNPESRFFGFDTFTGLPEDWGSVKKGSYSAQGKIPDNITDQRVKYCIGLIQSTLPVFVKNYHRETRLIIHIDVDLYNATLFTLLQFVPFLRQGDVIIFDEYFSITKGDHEFRAWMDFQTLYPIPYRPVYKCRRGQYVLEIL